MTREPHTVTTETRVADAVEKLLAAKVGGLPVLEGGRLVGIFTERDVLTRVVGRDLDARTTPLGAVMTRTPQALTAGDRVAYAIHCMSVAGYRTIPLVDGGGRPIGVVTVSDVVRWLASLFPETVLNLRPGDALKHPHEVDAG
jgi:CBS domain-containing protein